ncbi:translocation/assembly module TamB domain-containing protein, partial [Zemynaea arenosa]
SSPAATAATVISNIRLKLHGDKQQWVLDNAAALTPWGAVRAEGSLAATRPYKLAGTASVTQSAPPAGQAPATLSVKAGGDLAQTNLSVHGQAGPASGDAQLVLAPYETIPLRSATLTARGIDPGFFRPNLPRANVQVNLRATIDKARNVSGSLALQNEGVAGPVDQQRLPLRAVTGQISGSLTSLRLTDMLVDLGAAGRLTGSGSVQRQPGDAGFGTAAFTVQTGGINLKEIYSSLHTTKIAGTVSATGTAKGQQLKADLRDAKMRLTADASLAAGVLRIASANLSAGPGSIALTGEADLAGDKDFQLTAQATHFTPSAFGDFPAADLNAVVNARGAIAPTFRTTADFTIRPSRLFGQSLSGRGKLAADTRHVSGVDASLALGQNTAQINGAFGLPGEKLAWRLDARQLTALRADLYGALVASGTATGTFAAPRTTVTADASGLGWVPSARKNNDAVIHASGEAWLQGETTKVAAIKANGTVQRLNPASFGSPLAGRINGSFDATARAGADWQANANVALQDSQLSGSPMWGHAKFAANRTHVSNADVDLHVGPNVIAAQGSFGGAGDRLNWKLDLTQLAALGPDFAGALRANGTLSGSVQAPSLTAAADGANIRIYTQQLKSLHGTASLGSGHGAADPLVSDIQLAGYTSGATTIDSARLQTSGTRGSHTLRLAARGSDFDALAEVAGGWSSNAWAGNITALQNRGRYAFTVQTPVPLRIGVAEGAGVLGLAKPQQLALTNAVVRLPTGTINIRSVEKNGPRWRSAGGATGVPINYLAQFSDAVRENLSGDLTLGAEWSLDLQTAAATGGAPVLAGTAHVYREKGDLVAGQDVPVQLGLGTLDLRADVANGALRTQARIEGTRAGITHLDATAQLLNGRLANDSPLRMTASADMASIAWLAPLAGQPGLDLDGALKLALTGSGTIGAPTLNGSVTGDALAVRWAEQGVKLSGGVLRANLTGDQLVLQRLTFNGPQGNAQADGNIRFSGGEATMQLKLTANKLELMSRPDRTVVVTGESTLVRDAKHFQLNGKFRADRAVIEFAPQGRPTLSDDIIVLGKAGVGKPAKQATSMPLNMDIEADLGDDFRLRAMGLDANLAGSAHIRIVDRRPPRVNGSIRVVNGTYDAYGQHLTIERGIINFTGAYDNPSLNILAVRKRPEGEQLSETNVEAGVEVRGTALAPAAKLVSTPNVSDSDKLAWLVLGHGMDTMAGQEAGVLSAAAGALFGGTGGGIKSRLANSLGVDELGLSQAKGLESTVVTVGKRISQRAYLSFEQGAGTATSLVKLRYKLNPRITLQFQTGANTALDVLYSWAFD